MSSIMNIAMMFGTVFYAEAFGYFAKENPFVVTPSMGFYIASGLIILTLVLLITVARPAHAAHMAKS